MNFEHTEDRRMIQDTLTRFLADKYDIEKRNEIAYGELGRSPELWAEMAELGIIGALFTPEQGGFGGSGFDISVIFQAVGQALCPEPFLGQLLAGHTLAEAGEVYASLLEKVVSGEKIGAFAHEEEGSHYQLEFVATTASKADNGWVLNGVKSVVPHAETSDFFIVSARSSGTAADKNGINLFVVPKDVNGLTIRGYNNSDGGRAGEVILESVALPDAAMIAGGESAYALLEKATGLAHLALSAEAVGATEIIITGTNEYLQTRKQFGVPIGKFQALQHRMVDLVMEADSLLSAVLNASAMSADPIERAKALSAAKMTAAATGTLVAEEAIQLHGGIAMTWELPLSHYAKRLIMISHQFGDEDYHLARYIELGKMQAA